MINPSQYYFYFADYEDKLGAAEGRFIGLMLICANVFSAGSINFEVNQDCIYFQRQHAGTLLAPPLTHMLRIGTGGGHL
jgi:hypothetical protein